MDHQGKTPLDRSVKLNIEYDYRFFSSLIIQFTNITWVLHHLLVICRSISLAAIRRLLRYVRFKSTLNLWSIHCCFVNEHWSLRFCLYVPLYEKYSFILELFIIICNLFKFGAIFYVLMLLTTNKLLPLTTLLIYYFSRRFVIKFPHQFPCPRMINWMNDGVIWWKTDMHREKELQIQHII